MEKILEWLNSNIPVVTGAVFAFCISLMTIREGSFRERLTKATLCSIFSTGIFYGMVSIFPTCPPEAAVAIGSFVRPNKSPYPGQNNRPHGQKSAAGE